MAQESWKLDKDETDCELLKPRASSPAASPPPQSPPAIPSKLLSAAAATLKLKLTESTIVDSDPAGVSKESSSKQIRFMNRCTSCQKKVGLAGFRCRCGDLFCGRHRYSDTHDCSFDYKSAGREQIAKANPLVRAAKIIKI